MQAFLSLAVMLSAAAHDAPAGPRVPYEAVVQEDHTEVLAGPGGRNYKPTSRLNRGDHVRVIRHDPGGWYAIVPPPGSFSWIDARTVRPQSRGRGVLTENDVVVWVGSQFDASLDTKQGTLSTGSEVEIIEEATIETPRGRRRMFKIKPPDYEQRWVRGKFVASEGEIAQHRPGNYDPPAPAPEPAHGPILKPSDSHHHENEPPTLNISNRDSVRRSGPSVDELETGRIRLKELDDRFRKMIERDPSQWDLSELQRGYEDVRRSTESTALMTQVGLRLDAVERYRKIKRDYDEFVQLTRATDRRDAQLLSMQQQPGNQDGSTLVMPESPAPVPQYPQPAPRPVLRPYPENNGWQTSYPYPAPQPQRYGYPAPQPRNYPAPQPQNYPGPQPQNYPAPVPQNYPGPQPQSYMYPAQQPYSYPAPRPQAGPMIRPVANPNPGNPAYGPAPGPQSLHDPLVPTGDVTQAAHFTSQPAEPLQLMEAGKPVVRPFVGAGIVQRATVSPPGAPQHVLIAPNGRILAYLQGNPGVNLDASVGRTMGLYGERNFRNDLQMDQIAVRDMAPVRLTR